MHLSFPPIFLYLVVCVFLAIPAVDLLAATRVEPERARPSIARNRQLMADILKVRQRADATEKELQQAFLDLKIRYPVQIDWILQDHPAEAWRVLDGGHSRFFDVELLSGVKKWRMGSAGGLSALEQYFLACHRRRGERIGPAIQAFAPFAFTEADTFRMTFIGYTDGMSDARAERFFSPGTRLTKLRFPEGSLYGEPETLLEDPHGLMRDVDVSFDQERLLFAWKKSDRLDDYHIYEYNLKSKATRQLTFGIGRADYEPVYLPDGDIVFASTRPEQSVPCWYTEICNLYRMNGDGRYIRRLAVDQVQTMYPQLLTNGRIAYTRWDYSDRGQNFPHPVFTMNPDGQAQRVFYGGNSWFPNSLLHTRPIPGSHKVMSIASGHHTRQHGKLVILDVEEGRDEGRGMRFIAPKREVDYERVDVAMQEGDQFRYPLPLSEDQFLVSYLPDPGFGGRGYADSGRYGLYWMNADGEREFLYHSGDPDMGVLRAVSLKRRAPVRHIPDTVDYTQKTGVYYVHDVYEGVGLKGIRRGEAKKIRVVRLNYRAAGIGKTGNRGEGGGSLNSSPVSVGNGTWDVKEILGDVDIHPDGSALFEVPANESLYHQILDRRGRVIQTTRSWDTVRPGERKACMGCHVKQNANAYPFKPESTMAWRRGVQQLEPFYGEARGFSFAREIQPILDAKCVDCHDGSRPGVMNLTGGIANTNSVNKRKWTHAYVNLVDARDYKGGLVADPEGGIVTWISKMSRPTELPPYFSGAAKSPLLEMLDRGHEGVVLTREEYHKLAAWMDLLVPFSGDYREGHNWTAEEMRKYDYYEHKRDVQYAEEMSHRRAYMERSEVSRETPERARFTRAKYRNVLEGRELEIPKGAGVSIPPDFPVGLVDHLTLHVDSGEGGGGTLVIRARSATEGGVRFPFTQDAEGVARVKLPKPVKSDEVAFAVEAPAPVRLVGARGVEVDELPRYEGHSPHLALRQRFARPERQRRPETVVP